jgi:hypothetical protein
MTRAVRVTTTDIAELVFAGFAMCECREVVEAATGYKLSRLLILRQKAAVLGKWARDRGLAFDVADFDVLESRTPEGKGAWINEGRRAPDGGGLCFAYLSPSWAEIELAKAADLGGEELEVLGELFRIPPCCTAFYGDFLDEARELFDNDYAPLIQRATRSTGPHPWQNNYLAQYFGHSLIHHYPCAWDCEASSRRALDSLALIEDVSPQWAERTRTVLTGTVVHAGREGVHMVQGYVWGSDTRYRADQVVSTTYDALCARIKTWAEDRSGADSRFDGLATELLCVRFG